MGFLRTIGCLGQWWTPYGPQASSLDLTSETKPNIQQTIIPLLSTGNPSSSWVIIPIRASQLCHQQGESQIEHVTRKWNLLPSTCVMIQHFSEEKGKREIIKYLLPSFCSSLFSTFLGSLTVTIHYLMSREGKSIIWSSS